MDLFIEQDENGVFVASAPDLKGCHTQANSMEELVFRIGEAIELVCEVYSLDSEVNADICTNP